MSDLFANSRVQVLVAAAAGACVSVLLHRKHSSDEDNSDAICWEQIAPKDSYNIEHFGETGLQAQLISHRLSPSDMERRSASFLRQMSCRRTMRFFSSDEVPRSVLENCIAAAGTSPSGAHHQPWFFALIINPDVKQKVRELVEGEEKVNYERRMRKSWIQDLSSMTGEKADARLHSADGAPQKPYLTEAPVIIAMFKQTHVLDENGKKIDNYYVNESCGIAAGVLITALHNVGLATLTSTPMGSEQQIREMVGRPDNEKLFLLLPVGYPAKNATVPFRTPLRKPGQDLFSYC